MQYRREIDGLRAVAVLPVILFHAGLSVFSGGFVGVDVFFVISGYLITSILIADREAGRYSLLQFYERRARRILPALFVVMLVTAALAWIWMPPFLFEGFARSMKFTALFASNVHFWEYTGYFDLESEMQPLLHTWSLAIEEQYYILFPLLLMALGTFRAGLYSAVFLLIAALSLGISEWGWRNYPDENFFFTFSRFWELLAGSLCAVWLRGRNLRGNEALAGLGLAMILVAIFVYDGLVPFPSLYTLLPVIGTMLIILYAAPGTLTARVLSITPFVGVGLISYSAYLWHQPLFAFARIMSVEEPSLLLMMGLAVASLGLAALTWRFVEQPFRKKPLPLFPNRTGLFAASIAGLCAFFAFGQVGLSTEGFRGRLASAQTPYFERLLADVEDPFRFDECMPGRDLLSETDLLCDLYTTEEPQEIVGLMGDSHALSLMPGLQPVADVLNARIVGATTPACPPLLGVTTANPFADPDYCRTANELVVQRFIDMGVSTVFLVARWSLYATDSYDDPIPKFALRVDGEAFDRDPQSALEALQKGLSQTVQAFTDVGIRVVLLRQIPAQKVFPRHMIERALLLRLEENVARGLFAEHSVSAEDHDALQSRANTALDAQAGPLVEIMALDEVFRDANRYAWLSEGRALLVDQDHLSVAGAQRAGKHLADLLAP